jgi:uncharacterized protein YqeY
MSVRDEIQNAMKDAMRAKDQVRLETLRMAKGAILVLEKSGKDVTEDAVIAALRGEVRKRQQSIDIFREHGKTDEVAKTEQEIAVIEEFLPKQLSREQIEEKVRAYLADHPDINHAGKLTGALKKELGDLADGKVLNEVCREMLA